MRDYKDLTQSLLVQLGGNKGIDLVSLLQLSEADKAAIGGGDPFLFVVKAVLGQARMAYEGDTVLVILEFPDTVEIFRLYQRRESWELNVHMGMSQQTAANEMLSLLALLITAVIEGVVVKFSVSGGSNREPREFEYIGGRIIP